VEHQFKIGTITIDTKFYHTCETLPTTITNNPDDVLASSIKTFKETIIPKLSKHANVGVSNMNILAFSHGYVINKLLKDYKSLYPVKNPYAPNVSMFKEDYGKDYGTADTEKMKVVVMDDKTEAGGVFVRKPSAEQITDDDNYDKLNDKSPCSLYGLRGDVNKILLTDDYIKEQLNKKQKENQNSIGGHSARGSTRNHKKYRTRRNLSKHRKQTKRPRRANRIRKSRRGVKK
jgi:hypothetical protein